MVIAKYSSIQEEKDISKIETLNKKSNSHNYKISKRFFDIIFSITALILLSPIFLIISILIKLKSPEGNIFFTQERLGKDKKLFKIYKFRTMVMDAEEKLQQLLNNNPELKTKFEQDFKLENDPRIIKDIGTFLRKSSLDELPQFFNSLIGDLSIVGPRPIVKDEIKKYGRHINKLYSIKPGITGLWQVKGRNSISYEDRVKLDMEYIDNQSFFGDIKIILLTIKVMILREGI